MWRVWFLVGFAAAYIPVLFYLTGVSTDSQVLAEQVEITPTPVALITGIIEVEPTATPTPKPTPSPSPTPELTETPKPAPTATPDVWSPGNMEPLFSQFAGQYGVDKNTLERLANCESHFNPNALNGPYLGMFQYSASTWVSHRGEMGLDTNPELRRDVTESIKTAAFTLSTRGTAPWPSCL